MRGLGAVFNLFHKLTPGNADDPICLSSSDDEAPPPRATQTQRRTSAVSNKGKGKQRATEDDYLSDASASSNISISDILNSSQNVHSKSKSGTPKVGLQARKPSSASPVKGSVDLTVDSGDDTNGSRAAPSATSTRTPSSLKPKRVVSASQPSSSSKPSTSAKPTPSSKGTSSSKAPPTSKQKQQTLSSMFKDTAGEGSWSKPTPLIPDKKPPVPKPKEPAGPPPGTWGNPEPLIAPISKKRPKEASIASSDNEATPTKRPKSIGKTTARKSVGGRRMMAALAANRSSSSAASTAQPVSPRGSPQPSGAHSPVKAGPSWNTQAGTASNRPSRDARSADANRSASESAHREQQEVEAEHPLETFELPALSAEPEGGFSSPARSTGVSVPNSALADILDDDDEEEMEQPADQDLQLPSLVPFASQKPAVEPEAAESEPVSETAAPTVSAAPEAPAAPASVTTAVASQRSPSPPPAAQAYPSPAAVTSQRSISPPSAAQASSRPTPPTDAQVEQPRQTPPGTVERVILELDVEMDELGSDAEEEKADETLGFQLPALRPFKGNMSATSEDGDLIRTPGDDGDESDDDAVTRPIIEVPPGDTETYINGVLNPERDIEVILGPDPPKEPSVVIPFGGQAVPISTPRPLEQPPDHLRGKARREVGEEITEYNLTMRNLTSNPELQCEVFASYIGQATAHDEPFAPEIRVVNKVDPIGKPPPFEFVYSNEMLYHEGVPDPELGKGCDCEGPCDPDSTTCSCVKRQELYFYGLQDLKGFAYDNEERVKNTGCAIWECSETCGCPPECLNRVISRGRKIPVELFKTKGWGVKAKTDIKRGQFIGVYAGEMIPDAECESRGAEYEKLGRTYLFDLDGWHISNPPEGLEFVDPRLHQTAKETQRRALRGERSGKFAPGTYSAYSADAFHTGNFTRFINHSCDPNLVTTQAYFKDFHPERPCLVIVARRAIRAGEELCISYKGEPEDDPTNWAVPLMPVTSHKQSKTSAKAHFSPKKISARDDHCRCGAYNCDGKMFTGGGGNK